MKAASLRTRLTWLIIAAQVGVLVPLSVVTYIHQHQQMTELLDGRLAQAGRTMGALLEDAPKTSIVAAQTNLPSSEQLHHTLVVSVKDKNYEPDVGFEAYSRQGQLVAATANLPDLPAPSSADRGFHNLILQGHKWRTFTLQNRAGLLIRIGERSDNRRNIVHGLVVEHMVPLFIGLPLLALLVSFAVKRGLRPLDLLTQQLALRLPGSRQPVAVEHTPREITPLIVSLNQQIEQLEDTIEREHRFASDVAHELRTPLAATLIHLESAQIAENPREIEFTLQSAQNSLARLARRIEQILALARLEAGAASQQRQRLDLIVIATETIEELAPIIVEKGIALSLNHTDDAIWVDGHEVALTAMLRNLIENALRYSGENGRVEISIDRVETQAVIDVCDDGPGIPADRRDMVFERFRRAVESETRGYGLGLSIVQRTVQMHRATIALDDSPFGRGLRVRICMHAIS